MLTQPLCWPACDLITHDRLIISWGPTWKNYLIYLKKKASFGIIKYPFQYNLFYNKRTSQWSRHNKLNISLLKLIWLVSCIIWEIARTKHLEGSPFQANLGDETHPLCNIERGPTTSMMLHILLLLQWVNLLHASWDFKKIKKNKSKFLPKPIRSPSFQQGPCARITTWL